MDETKPDGNTAPPPPLRAFILEDNPSDAKLTARVLERSGIRLQFEVTDSEELFRENLEKAEYDVILADFNLRNWTALDALEILKQSGKDIPLIVVTGSLGDEGAVDCLKRGAADFVLKDRPGRLPAAVLRALEVKRLRIESERAFKTISRLATIVETSDNAIFSATREGLIITWNAGAERMYGYAAEEVTGKHFFILIPEERRAEMAGIEQRLLRGEAPAHFEQEDMRKDGSRIPVSLTLSPIKDAAGFVTGVSIIARDITDRKRAEAEHVRLVTAIEQSAEAVVITDTRGAIEYVNPAFTRITGYSREEALGQNPRILKSDKQDPAYYQQLWETILNGQTWHGELVNQRKDGSLYTEQMNIAPVRGALGEITHFIATKQDVTEHKILEEQVRQAAKMEAVGRLAGGVAHDFNNLLTIINGYTELLMDRFASDHHVTVYLKEIAQAGERAASLTRQLLAFSRSQVMAPQVLDLNAVVSNLEKMLKRLIGEDVEMGTVLAPSLGRVKADPGQIEQVIMNLVVNARDAMPRGGSLTIETSNVELDETYARNHAAVEPGPHVMLAVTDTGVGMTAETQAHIFEPFFTTKERGKGTGLGLATVYGIIKQSGGSIWAYSELGQGSVFKIYLPIVSDGRVAEQLKTEPDSYEGTETILVVEDEEGVRSMINLALLSAGYEVLETDGAERALEICAEYDGPIHLLLTDVVMPQVSGLQVAEQVAALRPGIKVLYMSGYTDDAVVRHGVLTQDMPFIQKPFSPLALCKKIREVLGENKQEKGEASGAG